MKTRKLLPAKAERARIQKIYQTRAEKVWGFLQRKNPKLLEKSCPEIVLCGRMYSNAGICYADYRNIKLGLKFIIESKECARQMFYVVLSHELAHQADLDLNPDIFSNDESHDGYHGKTWAALMQQLMLPPEPFHSMDIVR